MRRLTTVVFTTTAALLTALSAPAAAIGIDLGGGLTL